MILPEKTTITITSGESIFPAIYARCYTMTVLAASDRKAVISVNACNLTPIGQVKSDGKARLIEGDELDIPGGSAKSWLARLALKYDSELRRRSGSEEVNRAASSIRRQLEAMTVESTTSESMTVNGYLVKATTDADGHLTLTIDHEDASGVLDITDDIEVNEKQWIGRFTTEAIEEAYRQEDA